MPGAPHPHGPVRHAALSWLLACALVLLAHPAHGSAPLAVAHTALSSDCPLGLTSLTYVSPAVLTSDAATVKDSHLSVDGQALLVENVVQAGFHPTDVTTGAVFTSVPSYIASTELASTFRIDWAGTSGSPSGACTVGAGTEDATKLQWLVTLDVEVPDVLALVTIDATPNQDPATSIVPVLPSLYFSPGTAGALIPGSAAAAEFNLTYTCNAAGNVGIVLRLTLLAPDANGALVHSTSHTVKFSKSCAPASCTGLCRHGTCDPVTNRCVCDVGFDNDPYCSYRFNLDKAAACTDEDITLTWNATDIRADVPAAVSDWCNIFGPSQTCIGCPWTTELAISEYYTGYSPEWFYWNTFTTAYDPNRVRGEGQMTFTMDDDRPGVWAIIYFLADSSSNILAIASIEQLPLTHPQCLARAATKRAALAAQMQSVQTQILAATKTTTTTAAGSFWTPANTSLASGSLLTPSSTSTALTVTEIASTIPCIHGQQDASTLACVCSPGYWGPLCEQGCSSTLVDLGREGWFGGEFATTPLGGAAPWKYLNYANCPFLIRVPSPATGMTIRIPSLMSELADYLTITVGDSEDITTFKPVSKLSGLYAQGTSSFRLNSTYALVRFTSDLAHASEPWNEYAGAHVTYIGTGCPAGSYLVPGVSILDAAPLGLANVWRCLPCPAGTITSSVDATACRPCPVMTYAPSPGMSTCLAVERGHFQMQVGSTNMLACADYDWPSACESSPYPHGAQQAALLFFLVLVLVLLLAATGAIIYWRAQRVLFHASPQFIVGVMVGLVMFMVGLILHSLPQTAHLCNAKLFPLYMAPPLAFGALFVRSYRLHRIFHSKVLTTVRLPVWKLWAFVTGLVAVNLVVLIVLVAIAPFDVPLDAFPECHATHAAATPLLIALIAFNGLLLGAVATLAYKLRAIADVYCDTKTTLTASTNIFAVLLILLIFTYSPVGDSASTGSTTQLQLALGLYVALATFVILFGKKLVILTRSLITGSKRLEGESGDANTATRLQSHDGGAKSSGGSGATSPAHRSVGGGGSSFLPGSGSKAGGFKSSQTKVHPAVVSPKSPVSKAQRASSRASGSQRLTLPNAWPADAASPASPSAVSINGAIDKAASGGALVAGAGAAPSPTAVADSQGGNGMASPSGHTFTAIADVPGTPQADSVSLDGSGASSGGGAAVSSDGTGGAPTDWTLRINSIPLPSAANTPGSSHRTGASASGGPSTPHPSSISSSTLGEIGGTLRQRWQASRTEMQSLQVSVNRLKGDLEKLERQLARANNRTMTLAFEIENGAQ